MKFFFSFRSRRRLVSSMYGGDGIGTSDPPKDEEEEEEQRQEEIQR